LKGCKVGKIRIALSALLAVTGQTRQAGQGDHSQSVIEERSNLYISRADTQVHHLYIRFVKHRDCFFATLVAMTGGAGGLSCSVLFALLSCNTYNKADKAVG
jgi:hypothetical protein